MDIRYDASHQLSYGYFHCSHCKKQFNSGMTNQDNIMMHDASCPVRQDGAQKTTYCYGDKEIAKVRSQYQSFGADFFTGTIQELILNKEVLS